MDSCITRQFIWPHVTYLRLIEMDHATLRRWYIPQKWEWIWSCSFQKCIFFFKLFCNIFFEWKWYNNTKFNIQICYIVENHLRTSKIIEKVKSFDEPFRILSYGIITILKVEKPKVELLAVLYKFSWQKP